MTNAILVLPDREMGEYFHRTPGPEAYDQNAPERYFSTRPELRIQESRIQFRVDVNVSRKHTVADHEQAGTVVHRAFCANYPKSFEGKRWFALVGPDHFGLTADHLISARLAPVEPESMLEYPIAIPETLAASIVEQWTKGRTANSKYQAAVKRLSEMLDGDLYSLNRQQMVASSLLRFIEASIHAGDVGHLYSWYNEKLSTIRSCLQDLYGRKNPNHPGAVRSFQTARTPLYNFHDIEIWSEAPPSSHEVDRYLDPSYIA
jgi:hypothetical protein